MTDSRRRVAVTGAAGYIGSGLVKRLEADDRVEHVLATDVRPLSESRGPGVSYVQHDILTPLDGLLSQHRIDTVVHLAFELRPGRRRDAARRVNVGGAANVLSASAVAGVEVIVYLSSTSVYGARADNPPVLTEDFTPRPVRGFQYSEDKVEAEALVERYAARNPSVAATILRCCPVMGPNADNFIAMAFLKAFLVAVRGCDPPLQLIHEDDLTDVLTMCALGGAPGLYNVAGEGVIRWSEMAKTLGRRLVSLPAPLLYWATDAAWRLRLQSYSPSSGLDFIRYPWTAGTDKIRRELGVEPCYTSREAWEAFAERHARSAPAQV